jgi:hypothetical protein
LAKRLAKENSKRPEMNSNGAAFPRVRAYRRIRESSRKAKQQKEIKTMRNRNMVTVLATMLSVLACFVFLPQMQAAPQVVPAPDGCYPGFTTAEGCNALQFLTTGAGNTGVGWFALHADTTGNFNTGLGGGALTLNNGDSNTAVGAAALLLNTSGVNNTGVGTDALVFNGAGSNNTALGVFALGANTTGNANTAVGGGSQNGNIDGGGNTSVGVLSLSANLHGTLNTAVGIAALQNNSTDNNTAMGAGALNQNTIGAANTAVGLNALQHNVIGGSNVAVGNGALVDSTAGFNTAVGNNAGSAVTTAHNVIAISSPGADVSDSCFIGNIRGVTTDLADAIPVLIDSVGQLGTVSSSQRFKKDIKEMDKASEAILALKPVTFHYKKDKANYPQFGLIAEEVAKVNPDLTVRDKNGEIYTVRYDAVNAMLLNEFLKEHKKVQDLEGTVAQQQKGMEVLTAQLKEQAAQIQKVSAQVEMAKPATKVAVGNQ